MATTTTDAKGSVFFKSPEGSARYPRTSTPDTRFNAQGVYSVGLVLSREDLDETETKLRDIFDKAFPGVDGDVLLPIKSDPAEDYRYLVAKSAYKPKVMDLNRQELSSVEHGARIRIVGRARPYKTHLAQGVALYVLFVDVIDAVPNIIVGQEDMGTPLPF